MTKRKRDQVIHLLRCAADRLLTGASMISPFTDTVEVIHGDRYGDRRGLATCREIMGEVAPTWWGDSNNVETAEAALEAAARIEEGSWP